MKPGAIFLIILLLCGVYFLFIRNYLLARRQFKCLRCGGCCRLLVSPAKDEIQKIKNAGYNNFISFFGHIKRIKGRCMFLVFKDGISYCGVEDIKPKICRNFPNKKGIFGKKYDPRCKNFHYKAY